MKENPTSARLDPALKQHLAAAYALTGIPATRIINVSLQRILDAYDRDGVAALVHSAAPADPLEQAKRLFADANSTTHPHGGSLAAPKRPKKILAK